MRMSSRAGMSWKCRSGVVSALLSSAATLPAKPAATEVIPAAASHVLLVIFFMIFAPFSRVVSRSGLPSPWSWVLVVVSHIGLYLPQQQHGVVFVDGVMAVRRVVAL